MSSSGTRSGRARWSGAGKPFGRLERFGEASAHFVVDELLEVDDAVLASVRFQSYTARGASFGYQVCAVYRFTFEDDVVVRVEVRTLDQVPDSVRTLFGVA